MLPDCTTEILPTGCIRLRAADSLAEISVAGAEPQHWAVGGLPLLWRPDPAIWAETAPILFPVVGWTRGGEARVAGKTYPLGLHGFARHKRFRVTRLTDHSARLVLDSDAQTLALFPFDFRFFVDYELEASSLRITLNVRNEGPGPMPYGCGLHPGFRWPLSGEDAGGHKIIFDCAEEPSVPEIAAGGLFSARLRSVPFDGRTLELSPELLAREALCFLNAKSQGLRYEAADGATLRIETVNFAHFALWSRPNAPFLAIETWTGHGDPEGFTGDLFEKPSMLILPPGGSLSHEARFTFSPAPRQNEP